MGQCKALYYYTAAVQITIEIPDELAPQLAPADQDLARTALEAMAVEAYRNHRITGYQLRQKRESDENFEDKLDSSSLKNALTQIRGKYAFVQTSVDEFLQRKHEDVEREDS